MMCKLNFENGKTLIEVVGENKEEGWGSDLYVKDYGAYLINFAEQIALKFKLSSWLHHIIELMHLSFCSKISSEFYLFTNKRISNFKEQLIRCRQNITNKPVIWRILTNSFRN